MKDKRLGRIMFQKSGGNGGTTNKIVLPRNYVDGLGITKDTREVIIENHEDSIVIKPIKEFELWSKVDVEYDFPVGYYPIKSSDKVYEVRNEDTGETKDYIRIMKPMFL